jgi:hypothetical protein
MSEDNTPEGDIDDDMVEKTTEAQDFKTNHSGLLHSR